MGFGCCGAEVSGKDAKKGKAAKGLLTEEREDGRHGGGSRKDARRQGRKDGGLGENYL